MKHECSFGGYIDVLSAGVAVGASAVFAEGWCECWSSLFTRSVDDCDITDLAVDDVNLLNDEIHCVLTSRSRMQ